MAKSAEAFRTISEVAEWLDTPAHVLRFWESKFSQIRPVKRAGGRRYYRPSDMELLGGIKRLLHDEGMTIKGVQKMLRDQGVGHVSAMSPSLVGLQEPPEPDVPPVIPTPDLPPVPETFGSGAMGSETSVLSEDEGGLADPVVPPESPAPDEVPAPEEMPEPAEESLAADIPMAEAPDTVAESPAEPMPEPVAEPESPAPSILDTLPDDPEDDAFPVQEGVLSLLAKRSTPLPAETAKDALALARKLAGAG
ncbi:MerR family transcriptional regulator [Pseudooceanicola sp. HF7]|uniref:MerR family transcriptional regulator n=1 Tax=Pseudooceanicola sp. HF7 TaxID=2721560 RepID=UPI001430E9BB|nr:MerR family transcriptional regulator [Pseudooceanicola sp. HF7]NIZ08801.1 MerR family transcriptional regulator [Pseudooceanicola sp. HF7]